MPVGQVNQTEHDDRVSIVMEMLLAAYRRPEIIKFIRKKDSQPVTDEDSVISIP